MVRWPDARPGEPDDIDLWRPSSARMFDFFMGGSANFEIDREAGQRVVEAMPEVVQSIRANRAFLARAVRFLADQGIEQILDLGSGVPHVGSAHEIVHSLNPAARVIYVEREPVAVAHSRQVLDDVKQAEIVEADFRDVRSVLSGAAATGLIDFARPLGLLMISVLNFVQDDEVVTDVVRRYVEELVPGSYLVLSHPTADGFSREAAERVAEVYRHVNPPSCWRSPDEILALLRGAALLPPGLVAPSHWRPDREPEVDPNRVAFRAGIAEIGG